MIVCIQLFLSDYIDSEEVDAAVAAIFIHLKESVFAEIEYDGNDNLSTSWISLIFNVFDQVYSSDKQSEIVRETLATESSECSELIDRLAIWYFNEYPITIYSKNKDKCANILYYLADKLCGVDISEFEDYYEYEEVETGILEN